MMCLIYGDVALGYMREEGQKSRLEEEERGFCVVNTVFKAFIYIYCRFFPFNEAVFWVLKIDDFVKDFTRREN